MKKYNLVILIMMIGTFGILSTELGIIGILPQIAQQFHVSIDKAGYFVSAFSITIAISSLFIPLLVSKFNRKILFSVVLAIFSIASFISAFTTNFYVGLACRIIPAIAYPAYCSLTFAVVPEIAPKEEVQMGISKVLMGVSAGSIVGVPITTFFATSISYEAAMLWFSLINLLTLIATLIWFPNLPGKAQAYGSQVQSVKNRVFYMACIGVVVICVGICISYSYISEFLQSIPHILGVNLTLTLFLFGIASLVGTWTGGKLLTKAPYKTTILYPFVFSIVLYLLYIYGYFTIPAVILMIFWGAFDGVFNNIIQYWIVSAAPQAPEFANGIYFSMLNIGITIGTSIGGLMIVTIGTMSIFLGSIIVLLLSVIFILWRIYWEKGTIKNIN